MDKCNSINTCLFLSLVMVGCSSNATSRHDSSSKDLVQQTNVRIDSIPLDFNFNLDRWNLCDSVLWVVDARQDPFLTGISTHSFRTIYKGGSLGQGPDDFICPGIVEGFTLGPVIYSNPDNKIVSYTLQAHTLHTLSHGKFPLLERGGTLPNSYTRVARISDSIYAGTYFNPAYVGVDILDPANGSLLSTLPLPFEQTSETSSAPYQLKVAADNSVLVAAYRYLDLLGFYSVDGEGNASLLFSIGCPTNPQHELFEKEGYDKLIKYYSDVACADHMAFLLFQGTEEENLPNTSTNLLIFSLENGTNLMNISLGRYFDQLLVNSDTKTIYLYTPLNEDYIFTIPIPTEISTR